MNMNKTLRYGIFAGLFIIPFLAFYVSPSLLFPFIAGKNFAFRIIVEIIFVLWAILALRDNEYLPKKSWILYTFGIFIIAMGIADFFGANPYRSFWSNFERMEGFIGLFHLFLYFVVVSSTFKTKHVWNWFWGTWIGTAVLMCLYSIVQLTGHAAIDQGSARVDGKFGNATYLAVYLMIIFFFTLIAMLRLHKGKRGLLYILVPVALLELFILYYTATRGAILGLMGGIVVAAIAIAVQGKEHQRLRKAAFAMLATIVIIVGGFFLVRNASFVQKSEVLSRFSSLSISDIKSQGRYFIWPMALKGVAERPVTGWGQNNFTYVFSEHYDPRMYNQEQWFDRAHNMFLDWFVAGGLITFLPYLALFVLFFWYIWKRENDLSILEKSMLTGLMSAYMFQGLFVFDNLFSYILFFSMLAYVSAESGLPRMAFPQWARDVNIKNTIAILLTIAAIIAFYEWNVRPIEAGSDLIDAMSAVQSGNYVASLDSFDKVFALNTFVSGESREQLASAANGFLAQAVPNDVKLRYATLAKTQLAEQVANDPNDARSHTFYASVLQSTGDYAGAIAEIQKAIALSPTKQSLYSQLGSVQIAKQDYRGAEATLKTSYELDTADQDAKILYGIGALYAGDNATATTILASVDQNTLLFDDRFVSALAATNHYQELVALFTKRIESPQGKDVAQNYIYLAIAYVQIGQKTQAIAILKNLEKSDPNDTTAIEAYIKQIGG